MRPRSTRPHSACAGTRRPTIGSATCRPGRATWSAAGRRKRLAGASASRLPDPLQISSRREGREQPDRAADHDIFQLEDLDTAATGEFANLVGGSPGPCAEAGPRAPPAEWRRAAARLSHRRERSPRSRRWPGSGTARRRIGRRGSWLWLATTSAGSPRRSYDAIKERSGPVTAFTVFIVPNVTVGQRR
jgi:hypothetical protein